MLSTAKYFWPSSITSSSTSIAGYNVIPSSSSSQEDQKEATISMRYSISTTTTSDIRICLSSMAKFLPASLHSTSTAFRQSTANCSANSSADTKPDATRIFATQTDCSHPAIYTIWKAEDGEVTEAFMDGEQ